MKNYNDMGIEIFNASLCNNVKISGASLIVFYANIRTCVIKKFSDKDAREKIDDFFDLRTS